MRWTRTLARAGVIPLLVLATACGQDGGGGSSPPTVPDANAPVIANLRVTFGTPCSIPADDENLPGTVEFLAFDYADADGNLRGGTVERTVAFAAFGGGSGVTLAIPSAPVAISGTRSGTITVAFCIYFATNTSATEQIKVTDASGKTSNVLTLEVPRPAGLPLLPRDAGPVAGRSLEFAQ